MGGKFIIQRYQERIFRLKCGLQCSVIQAGMKMNDFYLIKGIETFQCSCLTPLQERNLNSAIAYICLPGKQNVVGFSTCFLFFFSVILSTMSVRLTWTVTEIAQRLMMKTKSLVDSCQ